MLERALVPGFDYGKRKEIFRGSRCNYLCRFAGKSTAAGVRQGRMQGIQQCQDDTGRSSGCDAQRGERRKNHCAPPHGDPCLYGAIREQMDVLDEENIAYDSCPGVSSFCGAASALNLEYTLPDVSQSVIITRMAGRTPVPQRRALSHLLPTRQLW